ncbi:MAG: branched-chain amino acid aminotransferase [Thermodesulfobacteriota bacterium]|nr:branched-chain amino acid aminotransferase [Thermodesulfobacteriota bacterium]
MEIRVIKADRGARKVRPKDSELGFGKYMTDHMFMMEHTPAQGWHNARLMPYQDLKLDPAAMVFHYNQEVFEGLKAYNLSSGGIGLFRPEKNAVRINASARRMVIPEIAPELFVRAIKELVLLDREWIPRSEGTSLYIRPTMIASEAALGVRPSDQYLFYIIAGPVEAYYPEGFSPTRIFVSDKYVRAVKGGVGEAKTSGNYGATLLVSKEAADKGYTQVLWLDAEERRYIEEVGTSNIFFLVDHELVTPPLEGTILAGVTRDSVLELARYWGLKVTERQVSINEIIAGTKSGSLKEMFATGTAAVISPVGEIHYKGEDIIIADGNTGELSRRLYDEITQRKNHTRKER